MEINERHSKKYLVSQALIVFLAGAVMLGCQGLSSGGSGNSQPPRGNSLTFSSSALNFGNVVVGGSNTLTVTVTNNGSGSVTLAGATSSAKQFALGTPNLPITIAASQSATLSVVFTPDSATTESGTLSLTSNAENSPAVVSLTGVGVPPGQLTASPTSLGFGSIVLGNAQSKQVALTNSGDSSITISQASISGSGFGMSSMNLPLTLTPGQSTNLSVSFKPQANGAATGSIVLTTSASMSAKHARLVRAGLKFGESRAMAAGDGTFTIELTGDGQQPGILSVSPTSVAFVNVEVGNNQSQPASLTNTGGTTLTVTQATVTGAGFSLSGLILPLSLAAGQSTNFNVVFSPQSAGNISGNVAFISDASNPTLNLPLSGQSLAPGSLTVSPTSIAFGNVVTNTNSQQPATLTNTGGSSVTITQAVASGAGYSISGLNLPVTLTAGQSTGLTVTFAPQSTGTVNGSVTFTSNAPDPTLVLPLSGTGVSPGTLTPNPTSLNFGSVQVGNNKQLPESVKNTGGSNLTITQDTVTGAAFSVSGLTLPLTLTPGQSYTFTVTFTPQSAGSASGNLTLTSNASNPSLVISLSGTGTAVGQLAVNPTSLNFGNVVVGTNSQLPAALVATGTSVTVTAINSSSAEYTVSGITLPLTVQPGTNPQFTVTFTPQATGTANATISFTSNASNSPTVLSLTGNGTPPPQHSVQLSWTASTSPEISGYNVYRGTKNGGPYSQINPSLNNGTTYTDSSVVDGTTYYYVTTAVNTSNQESGYSNQATAVIPPP